MGFVRIFWKNNVQEAYLPKMSISGQIVSEIVAQLSLENSIQTLLNFLGRPKENLGVQTVGSGAKYKKEMKSRGGTRARFYFAPLPNISPLRLRDQAKNRVSFSKTDPLLEDFSLDKRNRELLLKTCKKSSRQV